MGIISSISRIFGGRHEQRSFPLSSGINFVSSPLGTIADPAISVSESTALAASTVYACCQIVAQAVASLPVHLISRNSGVKQYSHPLAKLLSSEPNEYMTSVSYRECVMLNLLLWGNGYSYIDRDELGQAIGLYPLRSDRTRPIRKGGKLFYFTQLDGTGSYHLTPDQVLHVLNFSLDGIVGISPIEHARQSIGLSLAMERYASKLFSNGGNVGGILTIPPAMNEEARKNFVASWKASYTGLDNSFKVAVLPDGMKFQPTNLDPEKGQMTAARLHQVREIARIYRVPPHMLGDIEKASYASIEQQSMDFAQNTVHPWVIKWEQESNRKLLLEHEKPQLETRFNLDAILRASTQERYTAYQTGRQGGWLSVNDIRRMESLPPVEGGDVYLSPLNMTPVNQPTALRSDPQPDTRAKLIEDAAKRVLTKEGKALTRAAKKLAGKPNELRAWAETFYTTHAVLVASTFDAPLKAAGLKLGGEEYAKRHCAASIEEIEAAIAAESTADELAEEWGDTRPAAIAQELLQGNP